jgi:hypothetical protein
MITYHSHNPRGIKKHLWVYFRSNKSNLCDVFKPSSTFVLGSAQEGWEMALFDS